MTDPWNFERKNTGDEYQFINAEEKKRQGKRHNKKGRNGYTHNRHENGRSSRRTDAVNQNDERKNNRFKYNAQNDTFDSRDRFFAIIMERKDAEQDCGG